MIFKIRSVSSDLCVCIRWFILTAQEEPLCVRSNFILGRLEMCYGDWHPLISCYCGGPLLGGMPMLGALVPSEPTAFPHSRLSVTKRHCFCMAWTGASCLGAMLDLGFAEPYNVPAGPFLLPVQVPLAGSTVLESITWSFSHSLKSSAN